MRERGYPCLVDFTRAGSLAVCGALSVALHIFVFASFGASDPLKAATPANQAISDDALDLGALLALEPPAEAETAATPEAPVDRVMTGAGGHVAASEAAARPSNGTRDARRQLFGAVGARFATDLCTTFTRAIPQAFSADPAWTAVPFGGAGFADLTLVLDDAGHLEAVSLAGHPSPALRSSIDRTFALLRERSFTSPEPTTRLRVAARVARDDQHDGLHGDVFALSGGSFVGRVGSAFFALPGEGGQGRRVDIDIRAGP
jgi:hypothetical protein